MLIIKKFQTGSRAA